MTGGKEFRGEYPSSRMDRFACYTGFLGLACKSIQGGPQCGNICGLIDEPPTQSF